MHDRTKVIKGLVEAIQTIAAYVPERYWGYSDQACRDAIELLKGQQAQWLWDRPHHFKCSGCGAMFGVGIIMYGYCPHCGREMGLKEEGRRKEWGDA